MSDYISRADAVEVLQQFAEDEKPNDEMSEQFQQYQRGRHLAFLQAVEEIKALPSAVAESDDLIIKGAKGIQDGLYNITDGKLFKYKAKGGTVRTYPIVPSADAKGANLINRHDATTVIREECWKCSNLINSDLLGRMLSLPTSRQTDCTEFIEWLVEVVMDDEDWELNAVAYGEIICRKLVKLGVLEVTEEPSYYIRPSADAEPKWTCTANFVAEQLDRLRNMTDEEKWNFFREFFSPSADAKPTVIRAKTFMRKEDFDKFAEDIKKQNKSIVCIPCDAEVVSADAVHGEWIRKVKEYNDCDGHRFVYWYECSVCGARPPKDQWRNEWHSNYCPSCGARMTPYKGGEEE